jgi:hypothetical protein
LRRGWTRFSLCTSVVLGLAVFATAAAAQRDATPKRENELTLAVLRPGHDSLAAAFKRYKPKFLSSDAAAGNVKQWHDSCSGRLLSLSLDGHSVIQKITVSALAPQDGNCDTRQLDPLNTNDWTTGRGLRLGDPQDRITELYGEPKSNGPSVKGSYELEFLYYTFDWAGADVPQAMEVYCARDTGRVVEITLAYSSL